MKKTFFITITSLLLGGIYLFLSSFFSFLPSVVNYALPNSYYFSYGLLKTTPSNNSVKFTTKTYPTFNWESKKLHIEEFYFYTRLGEKLCPLIHVKELNLTVDFKKSLASIEQLSIQKECLQWIKSVESNSRPLTFEAINRYIPNINLTVSKILIRDNNQYLFDTNKFPISFTWHAIQQVHRFSLKGKLLNLQGKLQKLSQREPAPFLSDNWPTDFDPKSPYFLTLQHKMAGQADALQKSHEVNILNELEDEPRYLLILSKLNLNLSSSTDFRGQLALYFDNQLGKPPIKGALNASIIDKNQYVNKHHIALYLNNSTINLKLRDHNNFELLNLPIKIRKNKISLSQGKWHIPDPNFPLEGNVYFNLLNLDSNEPLKFNARVNLLTEGFRGINNLVITIPDTKLTSDTSNIPLQVTGGVNINDLAINLSVPALLNLEELKVKLLPGSLVRAWGKLFSDVYIEEARFPLAGITLSADGINGRLQAILKTREEIWGQVELHLDGKAVNFLPNRGTWFWLAWGNGKMHLFDAIWDMEGKGKIDNGTLMISKLTTGLNQLNYGFVNVKSPRIQMSTPIKFLKFPTIKERIAFEELPEPKEQHFDFRLPKLTGSLELYADSIAFRNGGEISNPKLTFDMIGQSFTDFNFKGSLNSYQFEPIDLSGRWDGLRLRGQAWWPVQPAPAFRHLFSKETDFEVLEGDFRAQASFSAAPIQGFLMGGHLVFDDVNLRYGNYHFDGVDFIMPYQLNNTRWQFGRTSPVTLRIERLDNIIQYNNMQLDFKGFYPFDDDFPIRMSNIATELLGGEMRIDEIRLPQHTPSNLTVRALDSTRFWEILSQKEVSMSGLLAADFQILFNDPDWIIKQGHIYNQSPVTLDLSDKLIDSLSTDRPVIKPLLSLIQSLDLEQIDMKVNLSNFGLLRLDSKINAKNKILEKEREIHFNYSHEENIYTLWQSLNFSNQLYYWLEERFDGI